MSNLIITDYHDALELANWKQGLLQWRATTIALNAQNILMFNAKLQYTTVQLYCSLILFLVMNSICVRLENGCACHSNKRRNLQPTIVLFQTVYNLRTP